MAHSIQEILNRIQENQHSDRDIDILRDRLMAGDFPTVTQLGKYNVTIGKGENINIDNRIYQQWNDEAAKALIQAIQKSDWECVSNLTEKDYTQVEFQSTGIGLIDKFAQYMTDVSQKYVMRYGLKVAFSPNPNQQYFVSGGDQIVKFWSKKQENNWEIQKEIAVPDVSDLWFTSVAISSNGKTIAACKNYRIKVWRLGQEDALYTFDKTLLSNFFDIEGFDAVAFSPDGQILAANNNQDITLWNVETGEEIAQLSGHSDKVTGVTFNPANGRVLASCSYDKTIKLWDIHDKRCLGTLSAHRDAIYTLAFSPNGEMLASGGNDNIIKLWNFNTGEPPTSIRQHSDGITCLVFSPDGKILVSGDNEGKIMEWKITEQTSQTFPEKHHRGVTSITISPDGKTLISGGRDRTIKVWRR